MSLRFFCKVITSRNLYNYKLLIAKRTCISSHFRSQHSLKMSENVYPNDQPVLQLECESAFGALSEKEKLYSHYLSRAAWYGGLIVLLQTSPESPLIYTLLQKLFRTQPLEELRETALSNKCGLTPEEFQALLVYASGIYTNMGNYKGFGDTKFIPDLPKEKLERLVKQSAAHQREPSSVSWLWDNCHREMYSLQDRLKQLGLGSKGVSTYFSSNCTQEDADTVKSFIKEKGMEAYNTRVLKRIENGSPVYEIRLASSATSNPCASVPELGCHVSKSGSQFEVVRGDYSKLLSLVTRELNKAKENAANGHEEQMVSKYVESFETGSMDAHKDGSRHWILDKGPVVETYIGFIETYRDPDGLRGEFEGFVAMVNKGMSGKFANLVSNAEKFLPLLPWPKEYEKDTFLKPDFTSLDVLTFAGSGIPAGICIPNYDEIRQNEGFKNVSLGNVIMVGYKDNKHNFLSQKDRDLMKTHGVGCFEMQVGLHELLGHGSGKMFNMSKQGELNFDQEVVLHTETKQKISSWYKDGETYDAVFGSTGSAYEECRAECVGLYLCTDQDILTNFGFEGSKGQEAVYINWLSLVHRGLEGLEMYEPKQGVWLQAHCKARFVILQVLLEAGQDFLKVEELKGEDGKPDLLLTMDHTKIISVGRPAFGDFLRKLQVYKATADITSAKAMFDKYSEVQQSGSNPFGKYREVVIARKKPRKMFVQANTRLTGEGGVKLCNYEGSPEGLIQSWVERFQEEDNLDNILEESYKKDLAHFQFL